MKIIQNKHSGRIRPHEHTSYLPLIVLLAVVGIVLGALSISTVSAGSPPPQSGSVGLSGTVPSSPPKTAATITSPGQQKHFTTSPITVSGNCPTGTLVEIYKNDIFAGSTPCNNDGSYSLQIDLLYGQNSLTAQVYDVLNQAGPISSPVIVFYDASPPEASSLSILNFSGTQLIINTDSVYRGVFPGQTLNVPVSVIGGIAPYAVNVEWGDSSNKIIPVSDNSVFNASHVYQKPGTYQITLQASDSKQQVAFLVVAAIVNGQPSVINVTNISNTTKSNMSKLLVLWPVYAIALTLVVSFWMGERREKKILSSASGTNQNISLGPISHPTS